MSPEQRPSSRVMTATSRNDGLASDRLQFKAQGTDLRTGLPMNSYVIAIETELMRIGKIRQYKERLAVQ